MGKIDLPQPVEENVSAVVIEKKDTKVVDAFPDVEIKEEEKKDEQGFDKAERLISYSRFLDFKLDKENLSDLGKIVDILEKTGYMTKRQQAMKIKEIQFKIGGRPSLRRVLEYLTIENEIMELVEKLKSI